MSSRPTKPTQDEVDSLAAFIEAAEELQQEPFFGPDEKLTLATMGKIIIATLATDFISAPLWLVFGEFGLTTRLPIFIASSK
jgi:hypothetical protein